MPGKLPVKRALISTSDKRNIVSLVKVLFAYGIELIATGGTAARLKSEGFPITDVSDLTGYPELMDGRVKTLHPAIHAGILARRGLDEATLQEHQIAPIDLVIINLYPFEEAVSSLSRTDDLSVIDQIDIGGPTLLRSAAKNHQSVTAICSPDHYPSLIAELNAHKGKTTFAFRRQQAAAVFRRTAEYNQAIANYFSPLENMTAQSIRPLRYGENPSQSAQVIEYGQPGTLASTKSIQGKALSYNNLLDAQAAWQAVQAFPSSQPCCVIVKHATPCGIGVDALAHEAYQKAFSTDSQSAFGGIIAFNRELDPHTASMILEKQFVEVIIAPSFHSDTLDICQHKPSLRLLPLTGSESTDEYRSIDGGILKQSSLELDPAADEKDWSVPTKRQPTDSEKKDLLFAWRAIKTVKSNAIVCAKNGQTIGIGTGQCSRVFAAKIAIQKAQEARLELQGAVAASDAFFPFADGLEQLAESGITAIIQPGGSVRDNAVIESADKLGIAMIFTGKRLFRH